MLEIVVFIMMALTAVEWLTGKLSKRPDGGFRGISMGCGLFLVVSMGFFLVHILTDPKEELMAAGVVVPWLVLGFILLGKATKKS